MTTTINAITYNLDTTGAVDNTTQMQSMLDSFTSGSDLRIPSGKYKINGTINLKAGIKIEAQSDVTFIGIGTNDLFTTNSNTTFSGIGFQNCNNAININGQTGITVYWCNFKNNIVYSAINIYNGTNISISNSFFYNILKNGVQINGDSSTISITWNNFTNASVFGGYADAQISGHVYCLSGDKITVDHNTANSNGGQGIIFCYNSTEGRGVTNSTISNNHCEGNGQENITSYGGDTFLTGSNTITGNTCINSRFNQLEIWQSNNNIVTGNTVQESIVGVGNLGAICLFSTTGTTCTGNTIVSSNRNGISVIAGSSFCTVSNNTIKDTNKANYPEVYKGNGILLDWNGIADPHDITIESNTMSSTGATIPKSGIYSTSNTKHNNTIDSNIISGYITDVSPYALDTCGI